MSVASYGRATKKQIQEMVKIILNLDEIPKPDDAADAIAIAITHLNSFKLEKASKINIKTNIKSGSKISLEDYKKMIKK